MQAVLRQALANAQAQLRELHANKARTEEQIHTKRTSLNIDNECVTIRQILKNTRAGMRPISRNGRGSVTEHTFSTSYTGALARTL
jgi:hypothetical protein